MLLVSLALVGCGTAVKVPETVKVPVRVPCVVEEPAEPAYRFNPPYDDVFEGTRDLLGDRALSQAYELELRTALRACKR